MDRSVGSLLAGLVIAATIAACNQPKAPAEKQTNAPARLALTPAVAVGPERAAARVVEHLDNMTTLAAPLTDFCEEVGRDLNGYYDLAAPDFGAASEAAFSADQRAAVFDAYKRLSTVAGRCLSDAEGRRFNQRMIKEIRPLTGTQG